MAQSSCGVVTALNPIIGYKNSTKIANAAASIAIQHSLNGVPQCPDYDEAIALIGE